MKIGLSEYEEGVADGREESKEIIRQQQTEIKALKAENKFFKDFIRDVEILRKAQKK